MLSASVCEFGGAGEGGWYRGEFAVYVSAAIASTSEAVGGSGNGNGTVAGVARRGGGSTVMNPGA